MRIFLVIAVVAAVGATMLAISSVPPTPLVREGSRGHHGATSAVRHRGEARIAQDRAMLSQKPGTAGAAGWGSLPPRTLSHNRQSVISPYWRLERRYVALLRAHGRLGDEVRRLRRQLSARSLQAVGVSQLERDFLCIYQGENDGYGWSANTGNGYHGGLQMDGEFEQDYGPEFLRAWGDAENWPASVQITVSIRAYLSGRGFEPWPNTARACGLR